MVLMSFNKSLGQGLQNLQSCTAQHPPLATTAVPGTLHALLPARWLLVALGQARQKRFGRSTTAHPSWQIEFKSLPLQISPKKCQRSWNTSIPCQALLCQSRAPPALVKQLGFNELPSPPSPGPDSTASSLTNFCKTLKNRGTFSGLTD